MSNSTNQGQAAGTQEKAPAGSFSIHAALAKIITGTPCYNWFGPEDSYYFMAGTETPIVHVGTHGGRTDHSPDSFVNCFPADGWMEGYRSGTLAGPKKEPQAVAEGERPSGVVRMDKPQKRVLATENKLHASEQNVRALAQTVERLEKKIRNHA